MRWKHYAAECLRVLSKKCRCWESIFYSYRSRPINERPPLQTQLVGLEESSHDLQNPDIVAYIPVGYRSQRLLAVAVCR
jgi:hypothetical protein